MLALGLFASECDWIWTFGESNSFSQVWPATHGMRRNACREMTTRFALGASRAGIIRRILTESILLSALGGIAGLLLGYLLRNDPTQVHQRAGTLGEGGLRHQRAGQLLTLTPRVFWLMSWSFVAPCLFYVSSSGGPAAPARS
jgi:ABC-type lipoprotein release transport system permease subunit